MQGILVQLRWPDGFVCTDAAIVEAGLLAGAFTIVGILGTKFPPLPGRSLRNPQAIASVVSGDVVHDEPEARCQCAWAATSAGFDAVRDRLEMAA